MEEKQKIIVLWKEEGETPLGCIERAKIEGKIPEEERATYAGRLDPMAEGVLLVLFGDTVHKKDEYLKLSKEYEVDVLIGVSSDTGDILGIVEEINNLSTLSVNSSGTNSKINADFLSKSFSSPRISSKTRPDIEKSFDEDGFKESITKVLNKCTGTFDEPYPMYSSRTVEGEPLFAWARKGEEVEIPTHKVKIDSITLLNIETKKISDLEGEIISRIEKVSGDFRQTKIIEVWKDKIAEDADAEVVIAKIKVSCESGAYMRVLAEKIARGLGFPGLAYRIIRTKLGEYGRNS
jgi:tRNA U55 pseudouridine synthase TruB